MADIYDLPTGEVASVEHDAAGSPYAVLWGSESDRLAETDEEYEHTTGSLSGYATLPAMLADLPGAVRRS